MKALRRRYLAVGAAGVAALMLLSLVTSWHEAALLSNRSMLGFASNRWTTLWRGNEVERESRSLAGLEAVNCGRAPVESSQKVNDCILKASKEGRAFWGRYTFFAIDAAIETAVVGTTDGHTYEINFQEGPFVPADYRLSKEECPQPRNLMPSDRRNPDGGRLTCLATTSW